MHCYCGTNNSAPRWTFTDPCKPEVRPGVREELESPALLAAPAMNARDTKVIYGCLTLGVDRHHIGSVTATLHQEKGIITLESSKFKTKMPILLLRLFAFLGENDAQLVVSELHH